MLRRILALVLKEFLTLLREPRNRAVLLVPPILQTIVFGYGANFDLERIPVAVYDEDRTAVTREFASYFHGSPHFRDVGAVTNNREIAPLIERGRVLAVLHIPRNFSRDLITDETARIQMILDGRNSNTASLVQRYTVDTIDRFFRTWQASRNMATPRFRADARSWYNPNLHTRWYIIPAMLGLLTLVIVVLTTALSVSREREQGTLEQIAFTPFRPRELLLGKLIPGVVIGFFEATLMLGVALLWFRIPFRGSPAALYAGVALLVLCAAGIGLIISSLASTMQQSVIGAFFFVIPAILLSGFVTPVANMAPFVRSISAANPLTHFISLSRSVFLEGAGIPDVLHQLTALAAMAVLLTAGAVWAFKNGIHR